MKPVAVVMYEVAVKEDKLCVVGVGTVTRIPPFGKDLTTLSSLKVINSAESA